MKSRHFMSTQELSNKNEVQNADQVVSDDQALWENVKGAIQTFVSLEDPRQYDLLTGFVFGTYIQDQTFEIAPYLHLLGVPASGKSTLLRVLEHLCFHAHRCVSETSAVLFRTIEENYPCTLLLDEVGSYSGELLNDVKSILNAGNELTAVVLRITGKDLNLKPKKFRCGGMKVFAGLKEFEKALSSRCIKITMQRTRTGRFRRKNKKQMENMTAPLKSELERWREKNRDRPLFEDSTLFHGEDRVYDIFRALLTVCPDSETRETMISLGMEMMEESKEEEGDTVDAIVKSAILGIAKEKNLKDGDLILIQDIKFSLDLDSENPKVNPWKIGQACRRLGLKRKKVENRRHVIFNSSTLGTISTFQGEIPSSKPNSNLEIGMDSTNVPKCTNVQDGQGVQTP